MPEVVMLVFRHERSIFILTKLKVLRGLGRIFERRYVDTLG